MADSLLSRPDIYGPGAVQYLTARLSTLATTTIKTGSGVLHSVVIGNVGTAATLTLWDNTAASGTQILNLTTSPTVPIALIFDCKFDIGLTAVLGGTGAMDATFTYR